MSFIILFLSIFNTSNACTIEICTQGKFQGREALHRSISRVFVLYSCSVGLTSFSGLHFNALKGLTICCKPYKWNDILTLHQVIEMLLQTKTQVMELPFVDYSWLSLIDLDRTNIVTNKSQKQFSKVSSIIYSSGSKKETSGSHGPLEERKSN